MREERGEGEFGESRLGEGTQSCEARERGKGEGDYGDFQEYSPEIIETSPSRRHRRAKYSSDEDVPSAHRRSDHMKSIHYCGRS